MMNKKILTMLFGLLLAVGWTSSASAQAIAQKAVERYSLKPMKAPKGKIPFDLVKTQRAPIDGQLRGGEVVMSCLPGHAHAITSATPKPAAIRNNGQSTKMNAPLRADNRMKSLSKDEAAALKYNWRNPNTGESGTQVPATQVAKDPYQIYQLLKFVYKNPAFPGPYNNAWTSDNQPEDPVYYGGIAGGWNIPFETSPTTTVSTYTHNDINITFGTNYDITLIESITVSSGSTTISSWSYANNQNQLPSEWELGGSLPLYTYNNRYYLGTADGTGYITIPGNSLEGYSSVTVTIRATSTYSGYNAYVYANNVSRSTSSTTGANLTWTINGTATTYQRTPSTPTDVLVTLDRPDAYVAAISVFNPRNNRMITSWSADEAIPSGWFVSSTPSTATLDDGITYAHWAQGGTVRIPANTFADYDSISVLVYSRATSDTEVGLLRVCDARYYNLEGTAYWYGATIKFPEVIPSETYKPTDEGYTALIVAVKNDGQTQDPLEDDLFYDATEFTDSTQVINYIANNIDSVKLLTDGMRIGEGLDVGTVFNCDGTYNKFFFLGKGRARKKTSGVLASINQTREPWPSYACEQVPFKFMFEQFSPTSGAQGAQIEDFYSEMMDGHVYKVVHDCASVIQNGHQFSLSGNAGKGSFAFKGMNFFIPDYRLKYWQGVDSTILYDNTKAYFTVDGRDMNSYMIGDANGKTGVPFSYASVFAVNYAQYNPEHAPKVGIYLITLEATAKPSAGYDPEVPESRNFDITLTWVSSLDEMTNSSVPQSFTIYYIDDNGERHLLDELVVDITNPTNSLTLTYPWPQEATSQTFNYVVEGRGTGQYTPFVAWSNEDEVIIPGYDDFLALDVEHIESDFVIDEQRNYYRNFLTVTSEDDLNGLSYEDILNAPNQEMTFDIIRSVPGSNGEKTIATLTFYEPTANTVKYRIDYVEDQEQQRLDYTLKTEEGNITDAYSLENMGIDTEGILRVRGNGDLVIQPNGYHVNFKSITVKSGDDVIASWTTEDGDITGDDSMWKLSPGSMWVRHLTDDGEVTYYLEGGGYLYIENLLNQYSPLTVEIEAFGDGATIARVLVNDDSKRFKNNTSETLTWTVRASNNNSNN